MPSVIDKNLILIIDTAHPTARIVLGNSEKILGTREWMNTPHVGTDLLVYIEELLTECGQKKENISRIGVHPGPGSYGLVRMGIVTATILAQGIGAELVGISNETPEEARQEALQLSSISSIEPKYS